MRPPNSIITIRRLPPSSSTDLALITILSTLINNTYSRAYIGIWPSSWRRTTPAHVTANVAKGNVFCAYFVDPISEPQFIHEKSNGHNDADSNALPSHKSIVGTIQLVNVGNATPEFTYLAVSPSAQGLGLGGFLVQYVESETLMRGIGNLRCEALVPRGSVGGLVALYEAMGYVRVGNGNVESVPSMEILLVECEYLIFEKGLKGSGGK